MEIKEKYTSRAIVGGEEVEFECAVYSTPTWWPKKKEDKTFKGRLKKVWDTIAIPYYRIKNWFRVIYYEIRYSFQRMFRDYDDEDIFETFREFTKRYSKILTDYREYHYGYPGEMTEKEWDDIIDKMIYHLKYMDEEVVDEEFSKGIPDNWFPDERVKWEIMNKHKEEFFKLFSKYFFYLWD